MDFYYKITVIAEGKVMTGIRSTFEQDPAAAFIFFETLAQLKIPKIDVFDCVPIHWDTPEVKAYRKREYLKELAIREKIKKNKAKHKEQEQEDMVKKWNNPHYRPRH